jgi:autotransporter-associated beta strand protein
MLKKVNWSGLRGERRSFRAVHRSVLLAAVFSLLGGTAVQAATWAVAAGPWSSTTSWGGAEPTASDTALIRNGGTAYLTDSGEVCLNLSLGIFGGAPTSGTIEMTGGSFAATMEMIGYMGGIGTFSQSAGTNTISDLLYLGFGNDSNLTTGSMGTYNLSGTGQISAHLIYVGENLLNAAYPVGSGLLQQTGGSNTAISLSVRNQGVYRFTGGLLQINGGFDNGGVVNFDGGAAVINASANSIVNFGRPGSSLQNMQAASVTVLGANSLVILPAGVTPASFGYFYNAGRTHYAGNDFTVAAGQTISGCASINDHVYCSGTIAATTNEALELSKGLSLTSTGNVNLGSGTLKIEDSTSSMTGGTLAVYNHYVGEFGTGSFAHSAGNDTIEGSLYVAYQPGSSGTYEMSGTAQLKKKTGSIGYSGYVGYGGVGVFNQTGGNADECYRLKIGGYYTGHGTYNLSGPSTLTVANDEYVGDFGTGIFNQSAGTHTVKGKLYLGYSAGGNGTYNLSGSGQLSVTLSNEEIGYRSSGTFTQSGGTHTCTYEMILGRNANVTGAYDLSGGQLSASRITIGYSGTGIFTQSGGTNRANIYLAYNSDGNGTYNLNGGELVTNSITSGTSGTSNFYFNAGTIRTNSANVNISVPLALSGSGVNATLDAGNYTMTAQKVISGTGGLNILGNTSAKTVTLSAANTFTGDTKVSSGALVLSNANALQNSTLVYNASGGAVSFSGLSSATFGGLKGNRPLALSSSFLLSIGNNGQSTAYSGSLSGAGSIKKIGSGTFTLSGDNTYSGSTTVGAGTLQVPHSWSLPNYGVAGKVAVNGGGTLAVNAGGSGGEWTQTAIGDLLSKATMSADSTFGIDTTNAAGGEFAYGNALGGKLGLQKLGAGNLTLTGVLTYAGATAIDAGSLSICTPVGTQANVVLHDIVGAGDLIVGDGVNPTTLTAASIQVNSLTIRGTTGGTAVPEPGVFILICSALAVGGFWRRMRRTK